MSGLSYRVQALDVETTGVEPESARVWEVATETWAQAVNPGIEIPVEVVQLCRLSDEDLTAIYTAPTWQETADDVLGKLWNCDALVTCNGVAYDIPVLNNEHHEAGQLALPPVLDVRALGFEAWPNLENWKLGTMALAAGLVTPDDLEANAHGALFDCQLTIEVFKALPAKWTANLESLLAFQQRCLEIQAHDWKLYGVTPADGPKFLWFRTCRACLKQPAGSCKICGGERLLHATKKRRGQPVDDGFLRWLRGRDNCPEGVR